MQDYSVRLFLMSYGVTKILERGRSPALFFALFILLFWRVMRSVVESSTLRPINKAEFCVPNTSIEFTNSPAHGKEN